MRESFRRINTHHILLQLGFLIAERLPLEALFYSDFISIILYRQHQKKACLGAESTEGDLVEGAENRLEQRVLGILHVHLHRNKYLA
mgnify:CR=1 FL=1